MTGREGVQGATFSDLFMPTDRHALAYPYFTPSLDVRYVPAADLLDGSYDPANLRNGLVLLGVTGLGLVDEKQTPLGLMPGVEVGAPAPGINADRQPAASAAFVSKKPKSR